jgi:hypothetical protein
MLQHTVHDILPPGHPSTTGYVSHKTALGEAEGIGLKYCVVKGLWGARKVILLSSVAAKSTWVTDRKLLVAVGNLECGGWVGSGWGGMHWSLGLAGLMTPIAMRLEGEEGRRMSEAWLSGRTLLMGTKYSIC